MEYLREVIDRGLIRILMDFDEVLALYLMGTTMSNRADFAAACNVNRIGAFSGSGLVKNLVAPSYWYPRVAVTP